MADPLALAPCVLVLVLPLFGCGGSSSAPSPPASAAAPSSVPQAVSLIAFSDPASAFSTSDVRDSQEQIVRFNTAGELVWTADDRRFSGYRVTGNFIANGNYEVVFVTRSGERRAYFTLHGHGPSDPNRVCDIEVIGGQLVITETSVPMCSPQSSGPC